jgi:IstB-like ATP binding protein
MIDRLVHHAEVIALKGDSYRLKDREPRVPKRGIGGRPEIPVVASGQRIRKAVRVPPRAPVRVRKKIPLTVGR